MSEGTQSASQSAACKANRVGGLTSFSASRFIPLRGEARPPITSNTDKDRNSSSRLLDWTDDTSCDNEDDLIDFEDNKQLQRCSVIDKAG